MSDHDDLDSAESAASSALAAALRAPAGAARASALAHASRGLSALRVALACAAPAQLPPAALFSRAQQLRSFEATEARLRAEVAADARDARAADESPAANAVETALAASTPAAAAVPAPPAPAPARGAAAAAAASGSGGGGGGGVSGALSRTRASLAGESERLSALGELLAADSGALSRAEADYAALEAEVADAKQRVALIHAKGVRDARAMYGALAVLVAVAAYAVASRVLWLFGVALP